MLQAQSPKSSDYSEFVLDKRLKHECLRCREPALPDSDWCEPHRDDNRRRAKAGAKRRRKERRKKGVCIDCGLPSKIVRCRRCARSQSGSRDVATPPDSVVNKGHSKTETGPAFRGGGTYQTQRYVGHSRRGRLTLQEQGEEDRRDAAFVTAEMRKFGEWLSEYLELPLKDMPRIQREARRREALVFLGNARRFLEELEDKYGG